MGAAKEYHLSSHTSLKTHGHIADVHPCPGHVVSAANARTGAVVRLRRPIFAPYRRGF